MAIPHAQSGEVLDVRPLGADWAATKTATLIKTPNFEVVRMVLPAGKAISEHQAPGEILVHCLEGKIAFSTQRRTVDLQAGEMLYLEPGERHRVQANADSSFLLTIFLPSKGVEVAH